MKVQSSLLIEGKVCKIYTDFQLSCNQCKSTFFQFTWFQIIKLDVIILSDFYNLNKDACLVNIGTIFMMQRSPIPCGVRP